VRATIEISEDRDRLDADRPCMRFRSAAKTFSAVPQLKERRDRCLKAFIRRISEQAA
jgi:hypothetical protein